MKNHFKRGELKELFIKKKVADVYVTSGGVLVFWFEDESVLEILPEIEYFSGGIFGKLKPMYFEDLEKED